MEDSNQPASTALREETIHRKRKRSVDQSSTSQTQTQQTHTRTQAACEACRISKTRCDATRPVCAKCAKRGRTCVYPGSDPFSIFENLGTRILTAIENQGRVLHELSQGVNASLQQNSVQTIRSPESQDNDPEAVSRKDASWTPIASSEKILDWGVFPREKPTVSFPASAYEPKPNPFSCRKLFPSLPVMRELRDTFVTKIEPYYAIIDIQQLDAAIATVGQDDDFDQSASSCLVLLVLSLAEIWGTYPQDERQFRMPDGNQGSYTMALHEDRLEFSSIYFAMALRRMSAAMMDQSLLGVTCFCLFGSWYQYNFEPIQGWKMFRTASMLWETYNMKHAHRHSQRPTQEESLEQRLYWTCLKAEWELRHELPDLPPCTLQESQFPFPLPTFPTGLEGTDQGAKPIEPTPLSHYFFLAEVSLRRLLNRARHTASQLSPGIDSVTATHISESIHHLEDQLQQWLECLPPALQFNLPPDLLPSPHEPELVKLMRERYVEAREFLYRVFLYICLHGGDRLTHAQVIAYGAKATAGLRLSVYRIQTEKPFFRHMGSWIACRVRFNQALCLVAAARCKELGMESARYVLVPPAWRECVGAVRDRLEIWSDEGAGIPELTTLLNWLLE